MVNEQLYGSAAEFNPQMSRSWGNKWRAMRRGST